MKARVFISFIAFAAIIFVSTIGGSGCANIIPPSGGPRDTLPPVLLKATPPDSTLNFTGNKITMSFDEYINVANPQQELIVSPVPKLTPEINFKLNTLTVRLKDTLEPNTTYSINFGNAIKDVDEGNILKNFTYIFSTGKYFDSLELHGKVIFAEDGKTDSTLIVVLQKNGDDSAVIKDRPRYFTKLDKAGNFTFKYLAPGTFYIYAFKDAGGAHRYIDNKQPFAFADSAVVIGENNNPVTLYAYVANPEQEQGQALVPKGVSIRKSLRGTAENRLRFQTNIKDDKMDLLSPLTMNFELPLQSFDSSKISFSSDSSFVPINNFHFEEDTTRKKLVLDYTWKANTLYHLILEKDFAKDTTGKELLKTDTITFTTRKINEYGKLAIRFRDLDLSLNPVLEFVQSDKVINSYPLTSANFSLDIFPPGDYELRILNDANKNGKWDPGEFFGKPHKQPEIVRPVQRHITVKPDYDNDFEIEAPSNSPSTEPPGK